MWYTSEVADALRNAASYGFGSDEVNYGIANSFEWPKLKAKRDAYIHRLNGIYDRNLAKDNVDYHEGFASFIDANTVEIKEANGEKYTVKAKTIVVSVGGRPTLPTEEQVPGAKYGMDSDGFFDLETQPKRVAVVGAGYIAVELAGVFNGLGSDTHLFIRYDAVLRTFDPMLSEVLVPWMEKTGMHIHKHSAIPKIEKTESGTLLIHQKGQDKPVEVDALVWAIGRHSNIDGLGLDKVGVKVDNKGDIVVDEWQATNVPNIFAIGDVQGKALLTPVAIAAGRRLSNRLYGGPKFKDDKLSYEDIPSVVFSHPTIGSVGLSEPEAREKYGDAIKVYKTQFRDMSGAMLDEDHKQPTAYKLVCLGEEERVIGLHLIGKGVSVLVLLLVFQVTLTTTCANNAVGRGAPGLRCRHQGRRHPQDVPGHCRHPPHVSRRDCYHLLVAIVLWQMFKNNTLEPAKAPQLHVSTCTLASRTAALHSGRRWTRGCAVRKTGREGILGPWARRDGLVRQYSSANHAPSTVITAVLF